MTVSASGSAVPVAVVAGATAATGNGAGTVALTGLPVTGPGYLVLLTVMAITFVAVGLLLMWNPLGRGRVVRPATQRSSG